MFLSLDPNKIQSNRSSFHYLAVFNGLWETAALVTSIDYDFIEPQMLV